MEIYRDSEATVIFEHPITGTLYATVTSGAGEEGPITVPKSNGLFSLPIGYHHLEYDGPLEVVWTNTDPGVTAPTFMRTQVVDVVTPIVPIRLLRTLEEQVNRPPEELARLETTVRKNIEAYANQNFGLAAGSFLVVGSGGNTLKLPQRLVRLLAVGRGLQPYIPEHYQITGDGWYLRVIRYGDLNIKDAPPYEWVSGSPIVAPVMYSRGFKQEATYTISGYWGYESVPQDVQEAAMLLARDYLANESVYHDAYAKAVTSADWRLDFQGRKYLGTGNARADALLEKYKNDSMAVI